MPLAPYLGDPSLVTPNTAYVLPALPQNPETANAVTVTDPLKICVDDIHFLAKQMSAYRPHINMTADPDRIIISPFSSISVFDGTRWFFVSKATSTTITVANKEGGGTFTPNNTYYIYLKSDGTIVISADQADTTLLFKNPASGPLFNRFRYLGRCIPINPSQFFSFNMVDFKYTMAYPMDTNFSSTNFAPAAGVDTDLGIITPPGTIKLLVQLASSSSVGDALGNAMYLSLRATGLPLNIGTFTGYGVPRGVLPASVEVLGANYISVDVTANSATGRITGTLYNLAGGNVVAESKVRIWWTGYQE